MLSIITGRSVVSQAYAELIRQRSIRTGNPWRIACIHLAALCVQARNDLIDVQQSLGIKILPGGKSPRGVALAALFDNHLFNYPYKENIKQSMKQKTSRGVTHLIFLKYDYLILFNYSDIARIERLKDAVLNKSGGKAGPKHKAKTILLGKYGKSKWSGIWEPSKQADGSQSREDWNRTVSSIRVPFKDFLKKELDWVQPPKGAVQHQQQGRDYA